MRPILTYLVASSVLGTANVDVLDGHLIGSDGTRPHELMEERTKDKIPPEGIHRYCANNHTGGLGVSCTTKRKKKIQPHTQHDTSTSTATQQRSRKDTTDPRVTPTRPALSRAELVTAVPASSRDRRAVRCVVTGGWTF